MLALRPAHSEDLAFVARIAAGDEAAEEEFARWFSERFEYLAHCASVPWQDCQDVAQEAMLAALVQMRRGVFRGESKLGSWLARIVYGKAMDYWRERQSTSAVALNEPGKVHEFVEALHAPMTDYELVVCVHETLKTLPAQHRTILLLNRTEGYTLEEISRMLEMTTGQVSGKLYTAEEMFRRGLRDGKPPSEKTTGRVLSPSDDDTRRSRRERSTGHRSFAGQLAGMRRTGDQSTAHRILLRTRERVGTPIGRSAFAGV